jgi:hypothetical protein
VHPRDEAEALAIALDYEIASVADVVAWADAWLAAENSAHWAWSELALACGATEGHVIETLRRIPGEFDERHTYGLLLRSLLRRLREAPASAAKALFDLATNDALKGDAVIALAWRACDAIDLAEAQVTTEKVEDIVEEMRGVLTEALDVLPGNETRWRFEPG